MNGAGTKVIERVQALLAKAERTDNEHEADAFYAKAQELMLRHALDEAAVRAAGGREAAGTEPVVDRFVFSTDDRFRPGKLTLLMGIARTNRVQVVGHPGLKRNLAVSLIGMPADVEFVELLYTSTLLQGMAGATAAWKEASTGLTKHKFTSEFLVGYGQRVGARLREAAARAEAAAKRERAGTELVLRDVNALVQAKMNEAFPSLTRGSALRTQGGWGADRARGAGVAAGNRADLSGGRGHVKGRAALGGRA